MCGQFKTAGVPKNTELLQATLRDVFAFSVD
jgi:hypothetical protein